MVETIVVEQSRYLASTERMSWCTLEAWKYKKRNHNGGHDDFLFNCNIGYKRHHDRKGNNKWFSAFRLHNND